MALESELGGLVEVLSMKTGGGIYGNMGRGKFKLRNTFLSRLPWIRKWKKEIVFRDKNSRWGRLWRKVAEVRNSYSGSGNKGKYERMIIKIREINLPGGGLVKQMFELCKGPEGIRLEYLEGKPQFSYDNGWKVSLRKD